MGWGGGGGWSNITSLDSKAGMLTEGLWGGGGGGGGPISPV